MPTRISAGVGDHPCFLTFIIIMIPINCKIFLTLVRLIVIGVHSIRILYTNFIHKNASK